MSIPQLFREEDVNKHCILAHYRTNTWIRFLFLTRVGTGWGKNFNVKVVSYPCGNFSDTPSLKLIKTKGSIGHAFTVCIYTENQNQVSFYPFVLHEISILIKLTLGHLRYHLTVVPPQPNSQPDSVFGSDRPAEERS